MRKIQEREVSVWSSMILVGMAGGLGWGIRGQYGHESGALMAGILVGSVVAMLHARSLGSLRAARVVAFCALGVSVGGSMTYGQTLGLTQNAPLVGNWEALRWGYLGTMIKGGVWIGLCSALMAMQLSRVRYHATEMFFLLSTMVFAWFLGVYFLNEPFDPANRILPKLYFSADWYWEPAAALTPRREVWGGLLVAFLTLVGYARVVRRDPLVLRLAAWGFVAGAMGFSNGQMLQAAHSWNPDWIANLFANKTWQSLVNDVQPFVNWWNMMEISFGTIFGAILGLGLWANRNQIDTGHSDERDEFTLTLSARDDVFRLTPGVETMLVAVYCTATLTVNFLDFTAFDQFADQALTMIVIPLVAVAIGQWWPYLMVLPIAALPIAGKTARRLVFQADASIAPLAGWFAYMVIPLVVLVVCAIWLHGRRYQHSAACFSASLLLISSWLYFGLNFAVFDFPWPWQAWTSRTPSALIFTVYLTVLTLGASYFHRERPAHL